MKVVALVAQKGGAGKSVIAVHLAVCAARLGRSVAIVDLDPQASVQAWRARRGAEDVEVVPARVQEVPGLLKSAKSQGAELVLIDTAGRAEETARRVMGLADAVLIPCRPFVNDLEASVVTAGEVKRAKARRAFFVLNAVPVQGSRHEEAREALGALLPVAPVELRQRLAYADALNDGRSVEELDPKGKAAAEIRALYGWLVKTLR